MDRMRILSPQRPTELSPTGVRGKADQGTRQIPRDHGNRWHAEQEL